MIEELLKQAREPQEAPSFVLFEYLGRSRVTNGVEYMCSILAQLLLINDCHSRTLRDIYLRYRKTNALPLAKEAVNLCSDELPSQGNISIVVDALDEVSDKFRSDIVSLLLQLREKLTVKKCKLRILLTSFADVTIGINVTGAQHLEIRAHDEDLRSYIHSRLNQDPNLHELTSGDDEFVKEFTDSLILKSNGMFLLSHLHLNLLEKQEFLNKRDLKKFARDMKSATDAAYEELWLQILKQDARRKSIGIEVIMWLCFAQDRLHIKTLQWAVALSEGVRTYARSLSTEWLTMTEDDLIHAPFLTASCMGLVRIEKSSQIVSFAHPTAQETLPKYLEDRYRLDQHFRMAMICLRQFQIVQRQLRNCNDNKIADFVLQHPLLRYALEHFGYHAVRAPERRLLGQVRACFSHPHDLRTVCALFTEHRLTLRQIPTEARAVVEALNKPRLLHLMAGLSLPRIVKRLIWDASMPKWCPGFLTGTVQLAMDFLFWFNVLLPIPDDMLKICALDCQDRSPLYWAVLGDHRDMISPLVHLGFPVVSKMVLWALGQQYPGHKLHMRVGVTSEFGVQIGCDIIQLDPTTLTLDGMYLRPTLASTTCVKALIDSCSASDLKEYGPKMLEAAASKRLHDVVAHLLSKGVKHPSPATALQGIHNFITFYQSTLLSEKDIIIGPRIRVDADNWVSAKSLLTAATDDYAWMSGLFPTDLVDSCTEEGVPALCLAAEQGLLEVVDHLLGHGASVDVQDLDYWTPLMWAVVLPRYRKNILRKCQIRTRGRVFLGATVEIRGKFPEDDQTWQETPDPLADRKVEIARRLLDRGADINARDRLDRSVFDIAQHDCISGMLELLHSRATDTDLYPPSAMKKTDYRTWVYINESGFDRGQLVIEFAPVSGTVDEVVVRGRAAQSQAPGIVHLSGENWRKKLPPSLLRALVRIIHVQIEGCEFRRCREIVQGMLINFVDEFTPEERQLPGEELTAQSIRGETFASLVDENDRKPQSGKSMRAIRREDSFGTNSSLIFMGCLLTVFLACAFVRYRFW